MVRAYRCAAPIGVAGCALVAGMALLGNPFATQAAPRPPRPEIRLGAAELSLPESKSAPPARTPAKPMPAPMPVKETAVPVPVVAPAPAPAATATAVPVAAPPPEKRIGAGKRATIIVETLPAKPIIPPYEPKPPAGAMLEPHPPLPLDTETGAKGAASLVPAASPAPNGAARNLAHNG
jgi:hypothetical protein